MTVAEGSPAASRVRRVKLAIPPAPPDAIARPALIARLDETARLPLTRVIAGAGYGKTTLLAQWARQADIPVAWLSLDPADADLGRLAAHLAAAIQSAAPGALAGVQVLLAGSRALDPETLAEVLADDLLDLEQPVALILDDLHALRGSPSERLLDLLFVHPPPSLRLIVGSRGEPDLPHGQRLFGRGLAAAIGPADLRFAPEETAALLHADDARAAALTRRADGWAAGIRALAVAHPRGAALAAPLHALIHADILAGQDPAMAAFLADLAVAERVSPGLAAALSTRDMDEPRAAALLAEAERRGLFVARLDDRGEWWRLHPLLRESLLGDEAAARAAHGRASSWFAMTGMVEEAIDHAIKADRLDEAGALLADHAAAWLDGVIHSPVDWMDRLPPETLRRHPVFLVARARAHSTRANLEAARAASAAAEAALSAADPGRTDLRLRPLRQELLMIEGHLNTIAGDPRPLRPAIAALISGSEPSSPRLQADIQGPYVLGLAMDGRHDEAIAFLRDLLADPHRASDADPLVAASRLSIEGLRIRNLELAGVEAFGRQLEALPDLPTLLRTRLWGFAFVAMARYEQGDAPGAVAAARTALPIAPGALITPRLALTVHLVRALLAQGRIVEARAAVAETARLIDLYGADVLQPVIGAAEAITVLAAGDIDRAARWAGSEPLVIEDSALRTFEHPVVTQARVWIARNRPGDPERAAAALERVQEREASLHFSFGLAQTLPVLAVAQARRGRATEARETMRDALALEPGRMTQRFADAGPDALALLQRIAGERSDDLAARAAAVLAALDRPAAPAAPAPAAPNPLTGREAEILAMMANWRTNKEIAEALGISAATVHNHAIRIFRKLGVGDRRDAAEAARAAGWLRN